MTGIIATLIVLACLLLTLSMLFIDLPVRPAISTSTTTSEQEAKKQEIANYNGLVTSLQAQRTNIFDYAVIKALLPLFGYIIASVHTYIFTKTSLQAYNSYLANKYK